VTAFWKMWINFKVLNSFDSWRYNHRGMFNNELAAVAGEGEESEGVLVPRGHSFLQRPTWASHVN